MEEWDPAVNDFVLRCNSCWRTNKHVKIINRDTEGVINAFNEAIHNINGQNPQEIHTDAWRAYREGISKNFANVGHIAKCGINKPHTNNNIAERLNGTLRGLRFFKKCNF